MHLLRANSHYQRFIKTSHPNPFQGQFTMDQKPNRLSGSEMREARSTHWVSSFLDDRHFVMKCLELVNFELLYVMFPLPR